MKNWVLKSSHLIIFLCVLNINSQGQTCHYLVDTTQKYKQIQYIPSADSILKTHCERLQIKNFIALISDSYENGISIFILHKDSVYYLNSRKKERKFLAKFRSHEKIIIPNGIYYTFPQRFSRHYSDMLYLSYEGLTYQIIPTGSTIEESLECIKEIDYSLYVIINKMLKVYNYIR